MSNDKPSLHDEWVALSNLDQAVIALQSVVSLSHVLGDSADGWRYSATYEDAMSAFTAYLDDCVEKVATCKETLFKHYRERKGIPETNASGWWSPAAFNDKPAPKIAAKKKPSSSAKKVKSNVK